MKSLPAIELHDGLLCLREETASAAVHYTPLTPEEEAIVQAVQDARDRLREVCVRVPCSAPGCPRTVLMTARQYEELTSTFRAKYTKQGFICCCRKCQEAVQEMLAAQGYKKRPGKRS